MCLNIIVEEKEVKTNLVEWIFGLYKLYQLIIVNVFFLILEKI